MGTIHVKYIRVVLLKQWATFILYGMEIVVEICSSAREGGGIMTCETVRLYTVTVNVMLKGKGAAL